MSQQRPLGLPPTPALLSGFSRQEVHLRVRCFVFFILFWLHVWRVIDPSLIYCRPWMTTTFPIFRTTRAFLGELLAYPGGVVEYVSAFLCQLYYYPWLGALIVTAAAGLLCLATWLVVASVGGARPRFVHFVPPLVLLALYNRYSNALPTALAQATAVLAACAYMRVALRRGGSRLIVFLALSAVVYYVAGGAYLLFAVLCAVFEFLTGRRAVLGVVCLVGGAVVPCVVGMLLFHLRITDAYWRLLPYHQDGDLRAAPVLAALWLFYPAVAFAAGAGWIPFRRRGAPSAVVAQPERQGVLRRALEVAVVLIVGGLVAYVSFGGEWRRLLRIEWCAQHKKWDRLLEEAGRLPLRRYNMMVNWDVNRALFHTGRLGRDMCSFPQHPVGLVQSGKALPTLRMPVRAWLDLSEVLMDLGRVNEAEHMACEALETLGDHPYILQRVVTARAVKGGTEAVRILLGALREDLVWRRWAGEYLRRLEKDPDLSEDQEVQRLRGLMVEADVAGWLTPEEILVQLLERNSQNKMAFEYLMAHYLLTGDLKGFVRNIGRVDEFGYAEVPRIYQEAVALYAAGAAGEVDQYHRFISWETLQRHSAFQKTIYPYGADRRGAKQAATAEYGNTYFFYYTFSPVGMEG
ncbi:MAG: hypothetical protein KAX44_08780 [Candidatus Brocadiae bacterium]|nr:hypothetical protein [Candidatus Brocadiia bacterium]